MFESTLQVTSKMFTNSRDGSNKILWLFSDGELDSSGSLDQLRRHHITGMPYVEPFRIRPWMGPVCTDSLD